MYSSETLLLQSKYLRLTKVCASHEFISNKEIGLKLNNLQNDVNFFFIILSFLIFLIFKFFFNQKTIIFTDFSGGNN